MSASNDFNIPPVVASAVSEVQGIKEQITKRLKRKAKKLNGLEELSVPQLRDRLKQLNAKHPSSRMQRDALEALVLFELKKKKRQDLQKKAVAIARSIVSCGKGEVSPASSSDEDSSIKKDQ